MDGGKESQPSLYRALLDRFESLEASHEKLKEQFSVLLQETSSCDGGYNTNDSREERASDSGVIPFDNSWTCVPGAYFSRSPYRNVLECMGHAVHITLAGSGEIIYWNCSAEKLYGYKDYEVLGKKVGSLLIDEKHQVSARIIMDRLSWSGQFPFKKRSGQIFMAIVTKSPLYEDGELVAVITVSSDAAVFTGVNSETVGMNQDHVDDQCRFRGINLKKIEWHAQPQIASVPQIASSVSNLASKVLLRKRGDNACNGCSSAKDKEENGVDNPDMKFERPPRAPATRPRVISRSSIEKQRIDGDGSENEEPTNEFSQPSKLDCNLGRDKGMSIQQNGSDDTSISGAVIAEPYSPRASQGTTSCNCIAANQDGENFPKGASLQARRIYRNSKVIYNNVTEDSSPPSRVCNECSKDLGTSEELQRSSLQGLKPDVQNLRTLETEDAQTDARQFPNSHESTGSGYGSLSSKGDNDSNLIVDYEIRWEDLQLRDEIGQGSCAVVHRGIWNGSDVAVKVYFGNEYNEETLVGYKNEIDIMKRLRHPNVLLFLGAAYSQEKLAVVTEYLPRGSLFKTLHRNNQQLDVRRRLRMALDVARGMNYLHHRNPPIVHRDLKSSNLLVDKSWTLKVGDFGLSRLKDATFLTTKSGRGTPQWMAPEVLQTNLQLRNFQFAGRDLDGLVLLSSSCEIRGKMEIRLSWSDVYSFGVILWELMTVSVPWNNLNPFQVVGVVGFMDRRLDLPENIDPQVSSIICDCWNSKPESRPSFEDIIQRMTDLIHRITGVNARKSPEL